MSIELKAVLKNKAINQWNLFWLISTPMSIVMVIAAMGADLSTGPGTQEMIGFSVRWAVPILFIAMAASSAQFLFPGPFTMWWLRNRKYIGLCFAVAMAWQGLFISRISLVFREYYYESIFLLRDEIEGTIGYIFLTGIVLTSFHFGRKHVNSGQWKLLHTSAIYFLWCYAFSVYWWNLFYYPNPETIDYIYYVGGFLAFALRIAAWAKKRHQAAKKSTPEGSTPLAYRVLGGATIAVGLIVAVTGLQWQHTMTELLTGQSTGAFLVLWLPFWPFEPYYSLFIIGLGALLMTKTRGVEQMVVEPI